MTAFPSKRFEHRFHAQVAFDAGHRINHDSSRHASPPFRLRSFRFFLLSGAPNLGGNEVRSHAD